MDYLKLQLIETRKLPWKRASKAVRGTVVTLLMYCADMETNGRIEAAREWSDDDWQDLCDVARADVDNAVQADLAHWQGDDLIVALYDQHGQSALETRRAQGSHGFKGGRPRKVPPVFEKKTLPETLRVISFEDANRSNEKPSITLPETPSPDQSSPDHTTPEAVVGVGDVSDPRDEEARFIRRLQRLQVCATDEGLRKWKDLAMAYGRCSRFEQAIKCITWSIETARRDGVVVDYASQVVAYAKRWGETNLPESTRGIAP